MIEELTGGTRRNYCVSKTYSHDVNNSGSGQHLCALLSKFPCDINVEHTANRENLSFGDGLGNPRDMTEWYDSLSVRQKRKLRQRSSDPVTDRLLEEIAEQKNLREDLTEQEENGGREPEWV